MLALETGLGLAPSESKALSTQLAQRVETLSPIDLADILDRLSRSDREQLVVDLMSAGVPAEKVNAALREVDMRRHLRLRRAFRVGFSLVGFASGAAGAYHGYKRNQSVPWAVVWFLGSALFPVVSVPIMLSQGFAKARR